MTKKEEKGDDDGPGPIHSHVIAGKGQEESWGEVERLLTRWDFGTSRSLPALCALPLGIYGASRTSKTCSTRGPWVHELFASFARRMSSILLSDFKTSRTPYEKVP